MICISTLRRLALTAAVVFVAAGLLLPVRGAAPNTVYFNDITRGPAGALQIGTVTALGDQLVTVPGVGLGVDNGIGPAGEFDRQMHYSSGDVYPDSSTPPGYIQLNLNAAITSITIVPYFRIFSSTGELLPDTLTFGIIAFDGPALGPGVTIDQSAIGQPLTLYPAYTGPLPTSASLSFQISHDITHEEDYFVAYRQSHQAEDQTFEFGISVLSLDYTVVPEPGAGALLMAGLACLGWVRRQRA
jgi:PEP-CTERM motif